MRSRLTPLSSELRVDEPKPAPPSRLERLRRRVGDHGPPTTRGGVIARGLLRLGIWIAVACGIGLLVDLFTNRSAAFGFYITGAALLAIAFLTSAGAGRRAYVPQSERSGRVNRSFVWVLVGVIVLAVGVLLETFR